MATQRPAAVRGYLVDLDGTVYESGEPVPGAASALAALRRAGLASRFVTNTTLRPRRQVVEGLNAMGIDAAPEECLTAPVTAAEWLKERVVERVDLLLPEATFEEFRDFTIDRERPECVLVGDLGPAWTYPVLNRAFRELLSGADWPGPRVARPADPGGPGRWAWQAPSRPRPLGRDSAQRRSRSQAATAPDHRLRRDQVGGHPRTGQLSG